MPLDAIEVLRTVPLFQQVPEVDLQALAQLVRERSHTKGAVILSQGDSGDALFLIRTGQVKVTVIAENGREVILSVLGGGSFFGEMALLDGGPRTASVIAEGPVVCLTIGRTRFLKLLREESTIAIAIVEELARRLRAVQISE